MDNENTNVRIFAIGLVGGIVGSLGMLMLFPRSLTDVINLEGSSPIQNITRVVSTGDQEIVDVAKSSSLAVVSIVATRDLPKVERRGYGDGFQDFCDDPFFRMYFGDQCDIPSKPTPKSRLPQREVSAGTGFIIEPDGLILTNKHVVDMTNVDYTVVMSDGKKFPAKVLAKDPVQDIALIKIEGSNLPVLKLGDSSKIKIGETVIAIGNALGQFSNTVSKGVISGLARSIVAKSGGGASERLDRLIQTDAAINPGNSGGPLLNLSGEVIGVNTAIAYGAQSIGFAIPINQTKRDIDQVKKSGKISYAFLGVRYEIVNIGTEFEGAKVTEITPDSPASRAGINKDDIITEMDGEKVTDTNDLSKIIREHRVGDVVELRVLVYGREKIVSIKLEERK